MRPENLQTQIFLDSGDPEETKEALELLGFLDGQTTNPSLIAKKNPEAKARLESGEKFSEAEIYAFYKKIVQEISELIPGKSVSIEVYVDEATEQKAICAQAKEFSSWIEHAHIKYPITKYGLACAEHSVKEGVNVNMTLCFTQEQAAAVHAMAKGASKGQVFLSPFIGRLEDLGYSGMDLIKHIRDMYRKADSPVLQLAASVRSYEHFQACLEANVDIITAPLKVLKEWASNELALPEEDFLYEPNLKDIDQVSLDLSQEWESFDLHHPKTEEGIRKFAEDWNALRK